MYIGILSLWVNLSKENENTVWKDMRIPMFVVALFTLTEKWKQLKCPSADEWIKMWYTGNGILAVGKNETLPFLTAWIELEDIMLSEVSQTGKNKYYMFSLICGI